MVDSAQISILATLQDKASKGLGKLGKNLLGVGKSIDVIKRKLGPLNSQLAGVATAFLSIQGGRRALELAEQQVIAERKLLQSLRGQEQSYQRILKAASDLQAVTTTGDEELIKQAALLINMGVAAERIPDALAAAVDTSIALGIEVEAVAKGIGLFAAGRSGELGERIPELAALALQGTLAADGVALLTEKFQGAAAAIAETSFGRVQQELNLLGDAGESAGVSLVDLQAQALTGVRKGIERLVVVLEHPVIKGLLGFAADLLGRLGGLIPILAGIVALVAAVKFGAWVIPLTIAVGQLTIIAGLIAGVVVAALELAGVDAGEVFEDAKSNLDDIFKSIEEGTFTVNDLFRAMRLGITIVAAKWRSGLVDPIKIFSVALKDTIVGLFLTIFHNIDFMGLVLVDSIGDAVLGMTRLILGFIDDVTGAMADLIDSLPFVGEKVGSIVRTDLKGAIADDFKGVDDELKASLVKLREAEDLLQNSFENAQAKFLTSIVGGELKIAEVKKRLRAEEQAEREQNAEDAIEIARKEAEGRISAERQYTTEVEFLERRLLGIKEQTNREASESLRELRERELQLQQRTGTIGGSALLGELETLRLGPVRERLELIQAQIGASEAMVAATQAEGEAGQDIRGTLRALIDLRLQEQQVTIELRAVTLELFDTRVALSEEVVSKAQAAKGALQEELQATSALLSTGAITVAEAQERAAAAQDLFTGAISTLRVDLEGLLEDAGPELLTLLEKIAETFEQVASLKGEGEEEGEAGFFNSFSAGARNAAEGMDELSEAGLEMGRVASDTIAGGLADAFTDADFSFRKFAGNFIKMMIQMIAKMLAFKAISLLFGGFPIPFATGGPVRGFATGGSVPGPDVNSDVVPARLTPGEWVIQKSATSYYGDGIMAAINQRAIPKDMFSGLAGGIRNFNFSRFATGGEVPSASSENAQLIPVLANEETMERLLAGGSRSMIRFMQQNRRELK